MCQSQQQLTGSGYPVFLIDGELLGHPQDQFLGMPFFVAAFFQVKVDKHAQQRQDGEKDDQDNRERRLASNRGNFNPL